MFRYRWTLSGSLPLGTRLTWQAYLKKTKVKLELLTDIDMPLMVEQGIHRHGEANSKHMKDYL